MKLKPEQLPSHFRSGTAPIYLIGGDEPLLVQEAADAVRAEARRQGVADREVFHGEAAGFDWNGLRHAAGSMSLFADRRLIELRLPTGKAGKEGGAWLAEYAKRPAGDLILLILTGRLDRDAQRAAWYKAVEETGAVVEIWPVEVGQLPGWIARRMEAKGLRADREAVALLAERVEGNLLAASQEIDKLLLLYGDAPIGADEVATAVADSSRFDPFDLVDGMLEGNVARTARIVTGLQGEGVEPLQLLGTLTWTLRALAEMAAELAGGARLDAVLASRYAWKRRRAQVQKGLDRLRPRDLARLLRRAGRVDRVAKGAEAGRPWDELLGLCLAIAGLELTGR